MTKAKVTTNVPKSTLEAEKPKKTGQNKQETQEPVVVISEEQQIENELIEARENLKQFKLKEKQQREQHEKDVKKKLTDDTGSANTTVNHEHVSGVKRSKPSAPVSAYTFFKQANASKGSGWCVEKWKEMDEIAKKPFNDQANKDKTRYQQQMAEYEKIHAQVTHHKVQKKDLKKQDSDEEKKNTGPVKLTKKQKLQKVKDEKEKAKQERLSRGRTASDIAKSPSNTSSSPKNKIDLDDDEDEDEEENNDEDDEEYDSDEEDEDEEDSDGNPFEENEIVDDDEIYVNDDDDGWSDMKSGFKSHNPHTQKIKVNPNRRWNK
ncbi:HMG1/2 box-containing protein [Tieghemostelium lacteum]|uniref:HMG1/2 box-containing protein n=1 Tax=Tieghemostelium lacteum TaxID=361077 RepID=A0A151ZIF4_TIELA|nr:HMG1/2 box-containing protein [Tieghemostelium lacteum]|eukprot:KYQ93781.1 HMG1/2 box-containing protein [Tieghemostelium lacteum]